MAAGSAAGFPRSAPLSFYPVKAGSLPPVPSRRPWVAALLLLLLCSQVVVGILSRNATDTSADLSPAALLTYSAIYAVVCGSLVFYWRLLPTWLLENKLILCLPLLAFVSTLWSQDPSLTIRRSVVLIFISCLGVFIGTMFTIEELSRLVTFTAFLICLATLAYAAISPSSVYDPIEFKSWRGFFTQKNVLGTFSALGIISAIHAPFPRWKFIKYGTILMGLVLLLLSRSSTSLLALVGVLAVLPVWRLIRAAGRHIVVLIVVLLALGSVTTLLIQNYAGDILGGLGKNSNLSGRSQLWVLILQAIARRPLLGYGYNGFWLGLRGEALSVSAAAGWIVPHAHNGLLDILLGIGLVGGALFAIIFVRQISLAVANARDPRTTFGGLWAGSFLVLLTIVNATESLLLSANSIFWLLFVAVYANLVRSTAAAGIMTPTRRQRGKAPLLETRIPAG